MSKLSRREVLVGAVALAASAAVPLPDAPAAVPALPEPWNWWDAVEDQAFNRAFSQR